MQLVARYRILSRIAKGSVLTLVVAALSVPVLADDLDPFQLETTHWMSFDRYKDKTKHGETIAKEETAAPAIATPNAPETPVAPAVPHTTPVAAVPTRPINLPLMPGMNKGYDIHVTTTVDDNKPPVAQITNLETAPTIQLPEYNWQDAAEAARQNEADQIAKEENDEKHVPLKVRLSFLPDTRIVPTPSPEYKSTHGRVAAVIAAVSAPAAPAAPKKSAAELASCAAVDAYKKKQLEAIQGDRQTLVALQAAIAQLGLQKQLDFIPGANGSVSPQADNAALKVDLPISSPTVVK